MTDMDPNPGVIKTTLSWGPNALMGEVNETVVLGYYVYFADNCSRKIGDPIEYVPVRDDLDEGSECCQYDAYSVDIDMPNADANQTVMLMIVPNTAVGELTAGMTTELLTDWVDTASIATTTRRPAVAAGSPRFCDAFTRRFGWFALFAFVFLAQP